MPQISGRHMNMDCIFLPPIRLAEPWWRPVPQINEFNINQVIPNTNLRGFNQMATSVGFNEEGRMTQNAHSQRQPNPAGLPLDGFRLEWSYLGKQQKLVESASKATVERFLAWVRVNTGQYWAGRSLEPDGASIASFVITKKSKIGGDYSIRSNSFYVVDLDAMPLRA